MRVLKGIFAKFLFLLIIVGVLYFLKSNVGGINNITGLTVFNNDNQDNASGENVNETVDKLVYENISLPNVYFCPRYNCSGVMVDLINSADESVHCALFDLDLYEIIGALDIKYNNGIDVKIVVDNDNYKEIKKSYGKELGLGMSENNGNNEENKNNENKTNENKIDGFIKQDNSNQLSHNKFCVVDGKIVATGSFNPTFNDNNKNNNNLAVITSAYLSENYEDEFDELWNGYFGKGKKEKQNKVKYPKLISAEPNLSVENYFCPEDNCEEHVLDVLNQANKSIRFMLFSFTSDAIGDLLTEKQSQGIKIIGVVEKKQNTNKYSEYFKLTDAGIDIEYDANPYNLHHKVFIIDDEIVITGSYNPTNAGDNKNDENIIILHNKQVAEKFIEEFLVVSGDVS
ncbi:hypothetical protein J4434_02490 [Candidatus Woesearchaeota archaeon]|nr:hypothetical protein [Candidatus Woesearchaeota archaeon]